MKDAVAALRPGKDQVVTEAREARVPARAAALDPGNGQRRGPAAGGVDSPRAELGALIGEFNPAGDGGAVRIETRLVQVRTRQVAFGREYNGASANPRVFAHMFSDELHQNQRALRPRTT